MDDFTKIYAPPSYIDDTGRPFEHNISLVNWLKENHDKAKSYLRSNRGWKSAETCMAIYYGDETERIPKGLSKVSVKKLRRQAREAVANAANIRQNWQHRSRKKKFQDEAEVYDELRDDWFITQDVYSKLKDTLVFAAGGGTGYIFLWPKYDKATGQLEIVPQVLDWKQVLPFHAMDGDIDSLYGVTIHFEYPLPAAHEEFPQCIGILTPDRNIPSNFVKGWQRIKRKFRGVYDWNKNKQAALVQDPYPVCDVYFTWVRDASINRTGKPIFVGEPGSHYGYTVPSLYTEDGDINENNGRKLTPKDCKLFPYRRFIISSNKGIIYDGPPLFFNCHVPIAAFKFENVVKEFLGINLIRDGKKLEDSNNNMLRAIEDSIVGKLQPPMAISDKIDAPTRRRLAVNSRLLIGKVFEYSPQLLKEAIAPLLPAEFFRIDERAPDFIRFNQEMSDYLMGTADSSILSKLNQMPAADTQESFLRSLGALATDYSRGIEGSILRLAKIWLYFAIQVYTTDRVITTLGVDAVLGAKDFDPKVLEPKVEQYPGSSYGERLQKHIRNFSIYAAPNSLQERMSQTNKLILLQLLKMGAPIPMEKIYNAFLDDGEFEVSKNKWKDEQFEKIVLSGLLQKALQMANQEADPSNQLAMALKELIGGQNQKEGRPATNNQPPRLESKTRDGIPDSTIASY